MAVNKLDPKTIFASEAPVQDTPAVFNNRTMGWGESRKNGGRPTIKQMNALQQDTELKILWLNENAVTPFDATIDYPTNAVTIKDGVFKIFDGTIWNVFLDKSSVGLFNVDNTSDLNKPMSNATQTYIDNLADSTSTSLALKLDADKVGVANGVASLDSNGIVPDTQVKTTGVTADTYGSDATVPIIVVDSKGRITSASNTNIRSSSTTQTGVVQLNDTVSSTSTSQAATANAVRTAYNLANNAIPNTQKGVANGVAPLDATGKVPTDNLPTGFTAVDASEAVKGVAKIATTAIAQAGTNDTDIITAKKLRDALNAGGVSPVYGLRSWGIIKGTTTPASLGKGVNVASIVDEGVGQYKVTFITAMPNIDYVILTGSTSYSSGDIGNYGAVKMGSKTVNGFSIVCGAQTYVDIPEIYFGVTY